MNSPSHLGWPRTWVCLLASLLALVSPGLFAANPRIAVSKTPLSLPLYVAQEKGFFEKFKVYPELLECMGGVKCVQEMLAGRADLATSSELPIVFTAFERDDFQIITTFVTNKDDMRFVIRKATVKPDLSNLAGKRVGFVAKSSSHYFMDLFLLYQGIDPGQVVKVPMPPEQMPNAIQQGEVDAIAVWEPFGYLSLKLADGTVQAVQVPRLYTQSFNLSCRKSFCETSTRDIDAVMLALKASVEFIQKKPDEAKQIMMRHTGLDREFVDKAWNTYIFQLSLRQSLVTTMEGEAKWAIRERHVKADSTLPQLSRVIEPRFLMKLNTNAVDFGLR
ncbi:ABC transporter substrate-binding protein [Limnobacter humi]|uniref:ABC transporter substrate-binding protein n=1 Tax=Limnobacter humi TaxID=1778671 RepID=A0ABT1WJX1_9BURK|nr:ABC transporter substrate-binding protein [Limnobacter humi]MCQ8897336.1 ABC transporter substrate-binding protein [Limnobacter humi]